MKNREEKKRRKKYSLSAYREEISLCEIEEKHERKERKNSLHG